MNKTKQDNTSIAAYRGFETLKFLIKQPASVSDIIKHLSGLEPDGKYFSKSVIYKYLTTLKFVGIDIVHNKCKYEVKNLPFKIDFSQENIQILTLFNLALDASYEKDLSEKINGLFYQLKMRYSLNNEAENLNKEKLKIFLNKFRTPNEKQLKKLKEYEKYCKENFKLQILFSDMFGEKKSSVCEPIDVNFENNNIILKVFAYHVNEFLYLNSKQIIKISQLPSKCTGQKGFLNSTTIFKVKNRLAKRYTLRNSEILLKSSEDPSFKVISNKDEPKDILFLRLMKYSQDCEILTPKTDRKKFKELIEKTLSNYTVDN